MCTRRRPLPHRAEAAITDASAGRTGFQHRCSPPRTACTCVRSSCLLQSARREAARAACCSIIWQQRLPTSEDGTRAVRLGRPGWWRRGCDGAGGAARALVRRRDHASQAVRLVQRAHSGREHSAHPRGALSALMGAEHAWCSARSMAERAATARAGRARRPRTRSASAARACSPLARAAASEDGGAWAAQEFGGAWGWVGDAGGRGRCARRGAWPGGRVGAAVAPWALAAASQRWAACAAAGGEAAGR